MGSQCGRLCCRPFRKKLTLKERIESIFTQAPIMVTESYCRNKGLKLCEYLKDRRTQISSCVSEFKLKISHLTSDSERSCTIILLTLKSMSESLKDFLHITYICILTSLKLPFFSNIKSEVYETLKTTTSLYPEEEANVLEDILNELLRYLTEPKNLTKQEINLLQNLLVPIHTKLAENSAFDWKKLTGLILERIITSGEVDDEVLLLETFCKELFEFGVIRDEFFKFLISFLHTKEAWNKGAKIFESVMFNLDDHGSVIIKLMTDYLLSHNSANLIGVAECMVVILNHIDSVNVINFSEKFKKVLTQLILADGQVASKVLKLWSFKVDSVSFFRLYRDVLIGNRKKGAEVIVLECNKRIVSEMGKKKVLGQFLQSLVEVCFESIAGLKDKYSDFVFKNLGFVVESISGNITFTKIEIVPLFSLIVGLLKDGKINAKGCKVLVKIVMNVIKQGSQSHVPIILSLIVKIRTILNEKPSKSLNLALVIWILLKSCGIVYQIPDLLSYADKSIKKNLKHAELSSILLKDSSFDSILSKVSLIFSKSSELDSCLAAECFNFEDSLAQDSRIEDFEEMDNEDDYLGFGCSENEFSSASSMEFQDRIIDIHDIHAAVTDDDYAKILSMTEDQDKELLGNISKLGFS